MKTMSTFDFGTRSTGGSAKYAWDVLLSGDIYECEKGSDYSCKTGVFVSLARSQAKRRGMVLKTKKVNNGVVLQAVPASPQDTAAPVDTTAAPTTGGGRKGRKGRKGNQPAAASDTLPAVTDASAAAVA